MSNYPEHDKLESVRHLSQPAGELLEWLSSQGVQLMAWKEWTEPVYEICSRHGRSYASIRLCEQCNDDGMVEVQRPREGFVSWSSDIQWILAQWLDINLTRIEKEKRAMLESLRSKS